MDARPFEAVAPLLPALVRKSKQSAWSEVSDIDRAAREVFGDDDGLHSVFRVESEAALAAVAAYMIANGQPVKRAFKRPAYFFVVPEELIAQLDLPVEQVDDADCDEINRLHHNLRVDADSAERLVAEIKKRGCYNFRVPASAIQESANAMTARGCVTFTDGPCSGCAA